MIIFHFEGMSFSSAHDLKQWDFLDNNEIFSEFAQFYSSTYINYSHNKTTGCESLGADSSLICTC